LTIQKFLAKLNLSPAKSNADTCSFTATTPAGSSFDITNETVTINIGGAESAFTLSAKGRSITATNSCKLAFTKKSQLWTLSASMKKGSWASTWSTSGVTNTTTPKAGITVKLPVYVNIGTNRFFADPSLTYIATTNKSGSLK
ncbi:MAG TPA: hypothetical protein VMP11_13610, partial [Verrucomicrobiae bacterium]|nr:hypothetical protein [Verrucomicrobiae bacterium]